MKNYGVVFRFSMSMAVNDCNRGCYANFANGAFDKNGRYEFDCKAAAATGCFRLCQ